MNLVFKMNFEVFMSLITKNFLKKEIRQKIIPLKIRNYFLK